LQHHQATHPAISSFIHPKNLILQILNLLQIILLRHYTPLRRLRTGGRASLSRSLLSSLFLFSIIALSIFILVIFDRDGFFIGSSIFPLVFFVA